MPAADDDVPPLEDCSDLIAHANELRKKGATGREAPPLRPPPKEELTVAKLEVSAQKEVKASTTPAAQPKKFGGMKKGFLFGGGGSKSSSNDPDILRPKQSKEDALRLDEVQEAMQESLAANKEWVTDDLLSKVTKNEKLTQWLADPRMSHVLEEFQKNPAAAQAKYADNPEISDFFKQFAGLLGDHFSRLADNQEQQQQKQQQQQQPTADIRPAADAQVEHALAKPEVREALMDLDVQRAIEAMRAKPEMGERIMRTADSKLRHNLGVLVQAGVLALH